MWVRTGIAILIGCAITACAKETPEEVRGREALQKIQFLIKWRDKERDFLNGMRFVHDARTGLCYAHGLAGGYYGGPYAMVVPCESVPSKLLVEPSEPLITSLGID